MMLIL